MFERGEGVAILGKGEEGVLVVDTGVVSLPILRTNIVSNALVSAMSIDGIRAEHGNCANPPDRLRSIHCSRADNDSSNIATYLLLGETIILYGAFQHFHVGSPVPIITGSCSMIPSTCTDTE